MIKNPEIFFSLSGKLVTEQKISKFETSTSGGIKETVEKLKMACFLQPDTLWQFSFQPLQKTQKTQPRDYCMKKHLLTEKVCICEDSGKKCFPKRGPTLGSQFQKALTMLV